MLFRKMEALQKYGADGGFAAREKNVEVSSGF